MAGFGGIRAYDVFALSLRYIRRFFFDDDLNSFLAEVTRTIKHRVAVVPTGFELWRAQLGGLKRDHPEDLRVFVVDRTPHPPERMVPDFAREAPGGRANPPGIWYLYLASTPETAFAEVRPWKGALATVARFRTTRELSLVDLSAHSADEETLSALASPTPLSLTPDQLERCVWQSINEAFSTPHRPDDTSIGYLPTQCLAEHFREQGFDGIRYSSALGDGSNVMLFRYPQPFVEFVSLQLWSATDLKLDARALEGTG